MPDSAERPAPLARTVTGVPGLDTILHGGLLPGRLYLLVGMPGTGKTVLASQLCFNHLATGGRSTYMTFLSESHTQMISALSPMSFFQLEELGESMQYFAGYATLEQGGLPELGSFISKLIAEQRSSMLVIDGLSTIKMFASSMIELKRFLQKLQLASELRRCTTILLSHDDDYKNSPEHVMVDGLLELTNHSVGLRMVRELELWKLRGSSYIEGKHHFTITDKGITIYPRSEALIRHEQRAQSASRVQMGFGVPELDTMLGGGLLEGSATMLLGPHGSGKTLLAMHFLAAGARQGQPGLHFGFNEQPESLIDKAEQVGLKVRDLLSPELLEMRWHTTAENLIDQLTAELLDNIDRRKVRRLVIDGASGLLKTMIYPERQEGFFNALMQALHARNVTTVFCVETKDVVGPSISVPHIGISESTDNLIFLRYVELASQLHRLISILKLARGPYENAIREFHISSGGINVAATFESAQSVLTGLAQPVRSWRPESSGGDAG